MKKEWTKKEFQKAFANDDEFLSECARVCSGWGYCSWADDNPSSCPLLNGVWGAADEEFYFLEDWE